MNGRNRPNYYAIIPAKVRYDKNVKENNINMNIINNNNKFNSIVKSA